MAGPMRVILQGVLSPRDHRAGPAAKNWSFRIGAGSADLQPGPVLLVRNLSFQ